MDDMRKIKHPFQAGKIACGLCGSSFKDPVHEPMFMGETGEHVPKIIRHESPVEEVISGAAFDRHVEIAENTRRVLIVGVPRCGTTWVGAALSASPGTIFVDEPDDERRWPIAMQAKRHLSRYPIIAPGDNTIVGGYSIEDFIALWDAAWSTGNHFAPQHVLAKTTFVPYCLEWMLEHWPIDAVCWVDRHPLNTLSSWVEFKRKLHPDEPDGKAMKRMAWQYGQIHSMYRRVEDLGLFTSHVYHEDLCADFGNFEKLAKALGMGWNYRSEDWLLDMNAAGDGGHPGVPDYKRDEHLNRISQEQTVDRWKSRLRPAELKHLMKELRRWPTVMQEMDRRGLGEGTDLMSMLTVPTVPF